MLVTGMFGLMTLVAASLLFGIAPIGMWVSRKDEATNNWLPRTREPEAIADGGYREATTTTFEPPGPPTVVKVAAIGSWVLGQMFIPGLLLGLFGLIAMGIGLVSIPGLILAGKLFMLGSPLLRGEIEAAKKAQRLANFAFILNAIVAIVTLAGMVLNVTPTGSLHRIEQSLVVGVPILLYAAISVAHGMLLRRAATEVEKNHAAQGRAEPTWLRVEPDASADAGPAASVPVMESVPLAEADRHRERLA